MVICIKEYDIRRVGKALLLCKEGFCYFGLYGFDDGILKESKFRCIKSKFVELDKSEFLELCKSDI